jgi:hypothetical protein
LLTDLPSSIHEKSILSDKAKFLDVLYLPLLLLSHSSVQTPTVPPPPLPTP